MHLTSAVRKSGELVFREKSGATGEDEGERSTAEGGAGKAWRGEGKGDGEDVALIGVLSLSAPSAILETEERNFCQLEDDASAPTSGELRDFRTFKGGTGLFMGGEGAFRVGEIVVDSVFKDGAADVSGE